MERGNIRRTVFKLAILWLSILLLGSFWLTVKGTSEPVSIAVVPQAPREGDPIIATFKVNNPFPQRMMVRYQFYVSDELLEEGTATLAPDSSMTHKYAYENRIQLGQQLNFTVKTQSERGSYEKVISSPPYPPQIWSSFVSFASFSTSVMSSMSTMTYYQSTFGSDIELNVGIIISIVLLALLILLELTQPVMEGKTIAVMGRLRIRFSTVTWVLFIIFMSIVYTKVVMILVG